MSAGTQSGKTTLGPWWLMEEIYHRRGGGDYIAVTSSYDLFKLKMLPSMLTVIEAILGLGRYWAGDRIIELRDPKTLQFHANKASDTMWGRIILRSADALGGLESSTAKAAWLDECGQDRFTIEAYRAVRRRLALYTGRMLMTTTLYNIGWFTQQIIDPAVADGVTNFETVGKGEIEITDSPTKNTRVVQFDSILNPSFPIEEYEEARATLPDEEFQMQYRGRKAARRFLIYDNFDYAKHTVKPFPIPESWKRYMGVDFGGSHTAAMFYAEEPGTGKLYAYREYLAGGRSVDDHVKMMISGEHIIPVAYGGAGSEDQWRMEFAQHGLPVYQPAVKDVDIGINRVYAQHAVDGIIYFNNLSGILDEKGRYRRKRNNAGELTSEIEQKNTFHRLDCERYVISTIRPGASLKVKVVNLGDN